MTQLPMLISTLLAQVIPDGVEAFGGELQNAWPIFLSVGAVCSAILWSAKRGAKALNSTITEAVQPVADALALLLERSSHVEGTVEVLWSAAPEALFRTDADGQLQAANGAYQRLWGFEHKSQVFSEEWLLLLTEESRARAVERLESIVRSPRNFEFDMELHSGRHFRIEGQPIYVGDDFEGYVGLLSEV